jgi:hypothetical protein
VIWHPEEDAESEVVAALVHAACGALPVGGTGESRREEVG